ncbi:hypothetical protein OKA04_17270 [Luteolibacter flavescens]|uniref:DUF4175 family protein n=1 Tax=Luteolibacter flavescens TaxID=1859460 RepID=A0ABT3FSR8_9BACT|nr:hypothetical protein [Luteolibacter flavescens]MCW1886492.1 hypothetical protein [Luteolibacter flavescens]
MSTDEARREIGRRLEAVRSSIRRAQWTRGALVIATVMLGGLLLMMAVDHFLAPLPQIARWAMFGAWVLGTLVAAFFGLRPLLRKIGLIQVARWIEGRHPEIEERMSTVLELSGSPGGVSESLLEELARTAGEDVDKVDARAELKAVGASRKWARPAIAFAAMLLLLFLVWPKEAARLAVRAVAPFSTLGNAAAVKFTVEPKDIELLEGDALEMTASYDGPATQLEAVMTMPDGNEITQPMMPAGTGWSYRLDPVRGESFRYRVRAGRGESDAYEVTVWPLPTIPEPRVKLSFPEYTGLLPDEAPLGRGVEAVRGTKVELTGALNTAVEAAWLEIDGKHVADGSVEKSASGGRVALAWDLKEEGSGEAVVKLKHRLGREMEALRFPVRVLEDFSPSVRWLSPVATELRVRPDEVLGLRYEVTEDFGVAALQLDVKAGDKDVRRLSRELPDKLGGGAKPARYRGESEVAVGELLEASPGARELRLRVRAEDARPKGLDGPGVGHSEWLLLKIDQSAESLARQELRAEHDGAREKIESAMRQAREAKDRMDWHRGEMQKEELSKDALKHFEEARESLAKAQEDLQKLAAQMQESVHATKADEVRQASEQLAQARQELESAPLQDGQQRREEKLDHAREQAEAAIKNLEKAREEMDRDRQKVEELARFQELAQQQRELARQAEKQAAAQQEAAMDQAWQDRQRGVEEQLRQQLREQPQARAEVLEAQAAEARELAAEAQALSESQKGLEEQTKQASAESPEALRDALAKEQAKIAEEAAGQLAEAREQRNEAADLLPQAVAATEQAKDALSKGDDKSAAEAAKEAAAAMKEAVADSEQGQSEQGQSEQGQSEQGQPEQGQPEQGQPEQGQPEQGQPEQGQPEQGQSEQAEMKAGVEALAGRQEKVAQALDALAEGKTAEALQGLQQLQADEAKGLSEAIAGMPQAEGSGHMNEARDTSRQGGEQAQSAAQKGSEGKPQEAAGQHQQSAANLQRSADALGRAAEEFDRAAGQARGQQPEQHRAPLTPGDLAEAFQSASRASEQGQASQSANQAAQAAEAMAKAAQSARQQMQGQGPAGQSQPGQPQPGMPGGQPGEKPEEGLRTPEADPGVPPELAKLGISAEDWEKIQANLKSDVGGAAAGGVPEEYRGLVKKYFEAMTDE